MDKDCFLEFLQLSVGTREGLVHVPESQEQWVRLFHLFDEQALLGVSYIAVEKVSRETDLPAVVLLSWENAVRAIRALNQEYMQSVRDVFRSFSDNGFRCCILKGQASAALYPHPYLRQAGDIDIWVDGTRDKVMDFLRSNYKLYKTRYIHADVKMLDNIRVEVHFTPSWMFSPFSNRRLQRWFRSCAPDQFDNHDDALGVSVPTYRFDGVYMMLHIYRHLLEEGIGLRQLMDYYYLLLHLDGEDRDAVVHDLRHLGLFRFAGAVMYVLEEVFLLDSGYMLCRPSPRTGRLLLEELFVSGNFGRSNPVFSNEKSRKEGIAAHGLRKMRRNLRFILISPSEVFWMPLFNTWHYFWRRRKGYLYKGR